MSAKESMESWVSSFIPGGLEVEFIFKLSAVFIKSTSKVRTLFFSLSFTSAEQLVHISVQSANALHLGERELNVHCSTMKQDTAACTLVTKLEREVDWQIVAKA